MGTFLALFGKMDQGITTLEQLLSRAGVGQVSVCSDAVQWSPSHHTLALACSIRLHKPLHGHIDFD